MLLSFYSVRTIIRNKDWKNSFTLWASAVQVNPGCARARRNLGNELQKQGEYDRAISEYKAALEISTEMAALIYNNLGGICLIRKDHDNAFSNFSKAVEYDPEFPYSYLNRAIIYLLRGDNSRAKEEFDIIHKLNYKNRDDYYYACSAIGKLCRDFNLPEIALEQYQKAVRIDSGFADGYISIGDYYYIQGDYSPALDNYKKAIAIEPGNPGIIKRIKTVSNFLKD